MFYSSIRLPLIWYIFIFFTPLMSVGRYYEVLNLSFFLNKPLLYFFLASAIFLSAANLIKFKQSHLIILIFCIGLSFLLFNAVSGYFSGDMNFVASSLIMLLMPLFSRFKYDSIYLLILFLFLSILFFQGLTIIDFLLNTSLNPIYEIRYYDLTDGASNFRLQNNSLFGQKNAAGAVMSILFLLFIYVSDRLDGLNSKHYFLIFFFYVSIVSTFSGGGIVISTLGLLFFTLTKVNRTLNLFKLCLYLIILMSLFYFFYNIPPDYYIRKLDSFFTKTDVLVSFFSYVNDNPFYLLFGFNAFNDYSFYTESTLLDMMLNFGLPLVFLFILLFISLMAYAVVNRDFFLLYIIFSYFTLLLVQNSAFSVSSAILLLIVASLTILNSRAKYGGVPFD